MKTKQKHTNTNGLFTVVVAAIKGLAGAIVLSFLFGIVVLFLWNWLMPTVFHLTSITYLQSVGLILLARIIFGGFKHAPIPNQLHQPPHQELYKRAFMSNWKSDSGIRKWEQYDSYWKEEGEKAFQEYVDKKEKTNN